MFRNIEKLIPKHSGLPFARSGPKHVRYLLDLLNTLITKGQGKEERESKIGRKKVSKKAKGEGKEEKEEGRKKEINEYLFCN